MFLVSHSYIVDLFDYKDNLQIINKGKRPWDIGCPHGNFIEWQKKVEAEKKGAVKKEKEN